MNVSINPLILHLVRPTFSENALDNHKIWKVALHAPICLPTRQLKYMKCKHTFVGPSPVSISGTNIIFPPCFWWLRRMFLAAKQWGHHGANGVCVVWCRSHSSCVGFTGTVTIETLLSASIWSSSSCSATLVS